LGGSLELHLGDPALPRLYRPADTQQARRRI
jgi:hypothetical protein